MGRERKETEGGGDKKLGEKLGRKTYWSGRREKGVMNVC